MDGTAERAWPGARQMAGRGPIAPGGLPPGARTDLADGLAMSNVTVIDAKRGVRPRPVAGDADVAARLAALQEKAKVRDAHGILELTLAEEFAGKTAVVSSFGA